MAIYIDNLAGGVDNDKGVLDCGFGRLGQKKTQQLGTRSNQENLHLAFLNLESSFHLFPGCTV